MKNNDVELIHRILDGDETAFSTLIEKYQKQVHALAWRKIGDFHIAEEITQDAFLKAYQKLATLKKPQRFAGWLYVIATRCCQAWLRKKQIPTESLEEIDSEKMQPEAYSKYVAEQEAEATAEVQRQVVKKLLATLPESERTVITLHYFGEMTCEKMSEFLGVSANTIKSRLRRARNRLKKEEPMIREAISNFQISPNLTKNIMQEITRLKSAAPSGSKPLVPWVIGAASTVLIVLMLGIGSQYLARFQRPYSLDAQTDMTVEFVDAPVVLNLDTQPGVRNHTRERSDIPDRNSSTNQNPDTTQFAAAQIDETGERTNSKQQWLQINAPSAAGPVWSLSATLEGEIYAVFDYAGICKITSDGETWQLLTPMKGGGYSSTAHIAKWNNTLYFTPGDELLVSTDEGKTWESVDSPIGEGRGYYDFVFTDQAFYLRDGRGGIFCSNDAGKSWKKISPDNWYGPRHLVSIRNILIANNSGGSFTGLYRFIDNKWEHLQLPVPVGVGSIRSVVATENNLYVMVVARSSSVDEKMKRQNHQKQERSWWIFRSTDMGDSWTDITPTDAWSLVGSPPLLTLVAVKDTVLVIGKHDVSVARSIDSGNTWTYEKNTGISQTGYRGFASVMHAVALNESTFYVGGTSGIHRSTDGGKSWHRFNTGLSSRVDKIFAFKEKKNDLPVLYAITESKYDAGDLVKSTDGGKSWKIVDVASHIKESDRDAPYKEALLPRIVTIQASDGVLYAKGETYGESYKTLIYRISDDGNTLIPIEGMPAFNSQKLYDELNKLQQGFADSSINWPPDKTLIENLQKTYVGSSEFMKEAAMAPGSELLQRGLQGTFAVSGNTFYMEYNHKLFRWKLGEKEWYDTGVEETTELTVVKKNMYLEIAVFGETVYVRTRNGDLIQSIDGGDTWKDITPQFIANLKSPIFRPPIRDIVFAGSKVYVATHEGVITSNDGKNWCVINNEAGEPVIMAQLAANNTTLYGVSTTNSVYRLESDSGSWKQVTDEVQQTPINSLAVDGNTLYVGTSWRGVLRFDLEKL